MPSLRLKVGSEPLGDPVPLTDAPVVVGRAQSCDVTIDEALASRKHVRFRPAGDGWAVEDLGSRNGTLLNGESLTGSAKLAPGDTLAIGSTVLEFVSEDEQAATVPRSGSRRSGRSVRASGRSAPTAAAATAAQVEAEPSAAEDEAPFGAPGTVYELMFSGRCGEFTHVLERPVVTVGRGDDADITIEEDLASRVHCQFEVKASGLKVVDLESRNGTQVGGETINQRFLQRHDVVTIGESEIRVRSRSPLTTNELDQRVVQAMAGKAESDRPTLGDDDPVNQAGGAAPLPPSQAPVLVYVENGKEIRYRLTNETTIIGRSEKVALPINEPLASREHLIVRRLPNHAFEVEDLDSRNGTRVSGREVRGRIQLMPGDVIQVGETHMRFEPQTAVQPGMQAGMATPGHAHAAAAPVAGYAQQQQPYPAQPQGGQERRKNPRARPRVRATQQGSGAAIIIGVVVVLFTGLAFAIMLSNNDSDSDGGGTTRDRGAENDRSRNGGGGGGATITNGNGRTTNNNDRGTNSNGNGQRTPDRTPRNGNGDDENDEDGIPHGLRDPRTGERRDPTPEIRPDLWIEEGSNPEERRARAAWVEQLESTNALSRRQRYGDAIMELDAFIDQWETSLDAQQVLRMARNRASDIREAASQRWIVWQDEIQQLRQQEVPASEIRNEYTTRVEQSFAGISRLYADAMAMLADLGDDGE